MIKQIIYGTLGFSVSAVLIGSMLVNIPDVYVANTTINRSDTHRDDDSDAWMMDEYADMSESPFDESTDSHDEDGNLPMPTLFNTYHVTLGHDNAGEENVGRQNPMFFWDYSANDYSSGATYEWADMVENADVENGRTLGYDTNATPQGGEQIVEVETLAIEDKFAAHAVLPVDEQFYNISSAYGPRMDPIEQSKEAFHGGLDVASEGINGANIYSVLPGAISHIGENAAGYGHFVVVNHGDFTTLYAHMLEETLLEVGDTVEAGDVIGRVGSTGRSTGPHLHFEVSVDNVKIDPKPLLNLIGKGSVTRPSQPETTETSENSPTDSDHSPSTPTDSLDEASE